MPDTVILVGPKIFPPFDSAYSSIGFSFLKTLLKLLKFNHALSEIVLISSFDLDAYTKLYNLCLTYLVNNEFFNIVKKSIYTSFLLKHTWSCRDNICLDYLLLKFLTREIKDKDRRIIVQLLIPLKISIFLDKLSRRSLSNIKFVYYLFYMPSFKIMYALKTQLYDQIIVSSRTITSYSKYIFSTRKYVTVVNTPIDTEFFKPLPTEYVKEIVINKFRIYEELIEAKEHDKTLLLYIGPVHPDRFPIGIVIKSLKTLRQQGLEPFLIIATTVRYAGEDDKYVFLYKELSRRLNGIVKVYVRAMSEEEKLALYNLVDVVLYPTARPWSMAIPPLTVLEAYACAKPVIITSYIPGYKEILPEGFDNIVVRELTVKEFVRAMKNALNITTKEVSRLRTFCVEKHSIDVISKRLLAIYKGLWV